MWPAREAKPRFGTALERSAHDRETRLFLALFLRPNIAVIDSHIHDTLIQVLRGIQQLCELNFSTPDTHNNPCTLEDSEKGITIQETYFPLI